MIQQSQLQTKAMFLEPDNFHFYNSLLALEEPKIGLSLQSEEEYKLIAPTLSKKYSKKSLSKDTLKPRKQKSFEDLNSNRKFGHWSLEENKRYHWFLQIHNNHFFNKHLRRTDKIFKSMALFVGSRQAQQCRSHHQKMQKKHQSICNILSSLRREHYGHENEGLLIQDLRQNKVQIIDQILSSQFLQEERMNTVGSVQNIEGQKTSHEQLQIVQEIVYQFMNEEKKLDEEEIHIFPEKMECCDRDIVEILLSDQAPHNNYQMI